MTDFLILAADLAPTFDQPQASDQIVTASSHALTSSSSGDSAHSASQQLANAWPEYVLGPEDPLGFLDPDMPCPFFGV